ncbi:MAG: hypothetical protein HQ596_06190 [Candidatus Saganbacteria bacterium]|nr:hypothetical protein [Candidatus Saganbacteria bacterium]
MLRNVGNLRTQHLNMQKRLVEKVRQQVGNTPPKVLVFYGEHAPLEPMEKTAQLLSQTFAPPEVVLVEIPTAHTPLGYALSAHDFIAEQSQRMVDGTQVLADFTVQENVDFGEQLQALMREVTQRIESLLHVYNAGFEQNNGVAGNNVRKGMLKLLKKEVGNDKSLGKFKDMLDALRQLKDIAPLLELVCFELAKEYPGTYFATLHLQWPGYITYHMDLPEKKVMSTLAAAETNIAVARAINQTYARQVDHWNTERVPLFSPLVRELLPVSEFDTEVPFTVFEMPQLLLESTAPHPETLARATYGAFLLQDPFDISNDKSQGNWDMDYFRTTTENKAEEHAGNIAEFLTHVLRAGPETRVSLSGETPLHRST